MTKLQLRKYKRLWIAERRRAFFGGKKCKVCGATDSLELDHIDPKEKISHNIWSWSYERLSKELLKCRILCKLCHGIRTWMDSYQEKCNRGHEMTGWKSYEGKHYCLICRRKRTSNGTRGIGS